MAHLGGKRIAVTRSTDQADELCSLLEDAGAVPVRCATIRVTRPEPSTALDEALSQLEAFRWLVLTSPNGVRALVAGLERSGKAASTLDGSRVAVVGPATAATLEAHGVRPAVVAREARSRALAESLAPVVDERILLARSSLADPAVTDVLRRRGARCVVDVAAYETVPTPPTGRALEELRRGVDGITFTSPSTVRGFTRLGTEWRDIVAGAVVASIGPVTTRAARRAGLDVHAEADRPTMARLVEALAEAFASRGAERKTGGRR